MTGIALLSGDDKSERLRRSSGGGVRFAFDSGQLDVEASPLAEQTAGSGTGRRTFRRA